MSKANLSDQAGSFVRPYRNIPFDIGATLDEKDIASISDSFAKQGFDEMPIPALMKSFSKYIRFVFRLNEDIRLYIYSFGVGVFTMRDDDFAILNEKYAAEYCESRKTGHHEILKGDHKYSRVIFSTVDHLRKIVASN